MGKILAGVALALFCLVLAARFSPPGWAQSDQSQSQSSGDRGQGHHGHHRHHHHSDEDKPQ